MIRLRTGYSFRNAVGTLEEYAKLIPEENYAPITDRNSTYGWIRWIDICEKENIIPVLGIELAISPDRKAKRPVFDWWCFFSKSNTVAPLNRLITKAYQQFRYRPLLSYDDINSLEPDIIAIAGFKSQINLIDCNSNIYAGMTPALTPGQARAWVRLGVRFAAAHENFYPKPEDLGQYQVICGRGASTQAYPQHFLDPEEWKEACRRRIGHVFGDSFHEISDAALENSENILQICSKARPAHAKLPDPKPEHSLLELCRQGATLLGVDLSDPLYLARMERELALIEEKDFEDYFHIVSDITRWARARMVVGPARGSAAGSLVCYLLGITTIDPLLHGLIFERFIDINRPDLPDIDIDFSHTQRHRVIDYIKQKYGEHNVSRLGTVNVYKSRSALREACGALKIPFWKVEATLDSMIVRSSGDARALHTLEDTFQQLPAGQKLVREHPEIRIVQAMEGHPRHAGKHACAVAVSGSPLTEVAPYTREGTLMIDKKDAEELDILKIDCLGLTQLSILEDTLRMADLPIDALDKLPLDKPEAYRIVREGKFSGIFQVQGKAVASLARQIAIIDRFNDLVALSALARPGPLASGNADEWVQRRRKQKAITYPHPVFEPYLKDTMGVVIYQEQVMEIGRHVGDLSWEQVTQLRKAMSKSLGAEYFDQFGDPWKAGARRKGVGEKVLDKIWTDLCAYGSWGFNKSHAVAYGLLTYWGCWLKANYPLEFAAATLNHAGKVDQQQEMLRELLAEGFKYKAVDPEKSEDKWIVDGDRLIGPLQNIKGVGPVSVNKIIESRKPDGKPLASGLQKKLDLASTPLDELYPVSAKLRELYPDGLQERNIFTKPMPMGVMAEPDWKVPYGDILIVGIVEQINRRDANEAVEIAKRRTRDGNRRPMEHYRIEGEPTQRLNMWVKDDTGKCFAQIVRWDFARIGKPIVDRGRAGKALYAFKGRMWDSGSFRMLMVKHVRYLGDLELGREEDASSD